MKDRQIEQSPPQLRIPFLSAFLHCVSMTVIVFLRSSFGFAYLRPKAVFFVFSWAFGLFCFYAWHEQAVWSSWWLTCFYGAAAIGLYLLHLLIAFFRELYRKGMHDHDSGTPHFLRILRLKAKPRGPLFEMNWVLWVEPSFVLLAGLVLRFVFAEGHLSTWFMLVSPCLCFKEALNFWFQLRQKKRHGDAGEDAVDIFDESPNKPAVEAPKAVGKEKVRRARASANSAADELKDRQFAQVLRLMPPYTLEEAETNYRRLIKEVHPDPNQATPENNALAAELNEAIAYFRHRLATQPPS